MDASAGLGCSQRADRVRARGGRAASSERLRGRRGFGTTEGEERGSGMGKRIVAADREGMLGVLLYVYFWCILAFSMVSKEG